MAIWPPSGAQYESDKAVMTLGTVPKYQKWKGEMWIPTVAIRRNTKFMKWVISWMQNIGE